MKILLKQVQIADPSSPLNGSVTNILINQGIIEKITDETPDAEQVYEFADCMISPGWVDLFSNFCDPGREDCETLTSGANAAAAGGFTHIFVLPNTSPVIQGKTQVEYIVQKSKELPVTVHALGAITKNTQGNELAEMYDMKESGAIAFTDGLLPVQSAGLMLKALQYIKAFDGIVVQMPVDKSIGQHGLINEGIVSTQLGLPGIPSIAEEIIVRRDIELLRYTNSRLHITGVSTAASLQLIVNAKKDGLDITCSVTPYHLFFCDEDLTDYDTNLKVNPPLRSRQDMMALREAVKNDIVDCIASHHFPQNWDAKTCEFEYAKNGMIGLQTVYAALQTAIPELSVNTIVQMFSTNPGKIFNLNNMGIKEGNKAELTIFNPLETTVLSKENNQSKSYNSPFLYKQLKGKVIGIYNKEKLTILN